MGFVCKSSKYGIILSMLPSIFIAFSTCFSTFSSPFFFYFLASLFFFLSSHPIVIFLYLSFIQLPSVLSTSFKLFLRITQITLMQRRRTTNSIEMISTALFFITCFSCQRKLVEHDDFIDIFLTYCDNKFEIGCYATNMQLTQ